jgi:hypothetical protein
VSKQKVANDLQIVLMWPYSRLATRAGFETCSGISINPSLAEEDAEFLKKEGL